MNSHSFSSHSFSLSGENNVLLEFFVLFSGVHVQCLSVFICTEAQQWESLTRESREHLVRSLSTMASDSRPELQERAFVLKRTLENLD